MDQALAITNQNDDFLSPAATVAQLRERYLVFNQFVKDVLREGVDYQVIPGTGNKKSLVKPGAEKLSSLFGLSARFIVAERTEDWMGTEHGGEAFFYYLYRCELYRGERFVASCDGSCNSREKKYRYRSADVVCPSCGKATIIKGKDEYGGGWICFAKKGGCGAKYKDNDPKITDQPRGLVPNPDIADQVNTLQKMAQKRAFVGAVLIATNASEYFTQDLEDMPGFGADVIQGEFHDEEPERKQQPDRKPAPQAEPAPMTLAEARDMLNSKGQRYGDIDTATLEGMEHGINAGMKKPGVDVALYKSKLQAINLILADREAADEAARQAENE